MQANKGFTLIELLVVLVVTALTTTLLMTGLTTTWSNFEKLSSRNLIFSQAQIPKTWFTESFRGALLSHPKLSTFSGVTNRIQMITFLPPNSDDLTPQLITWEIRSQNSEWILGIVENNAPFLPIMVFEESVHFEYRVDGEWQPDFTPNNGQLPQAVRIQGQQTQLLATITRPVNADVPAELPAFGQYEF